MSTPEQRGEKWVEVGGPERGPQATVPVLNLIQKAAKVMAAVEYVPKNGWNDFHKYHYATEADITSCVRANLAEQGLMLIPTVEKVEWSQLQGKSGTDRLATMTVKFTLTDGIESKEFIVLGEGADRGDKATYKAMTGALKYALLKLFLIPTGDDPEKEEDDKLEQQRPPVQRKPADAPKAAADASRQSGASKMNPRAAFLHTKATKRFGMTEDGFETWATEVCAWPAYKNASLWAPVDMDAMARALEQLEAKDVA
jgi:hypothetical protein